MNQVKENPENTSKINNPLRISRIVTKMCQGRMQALIRTKDNAKLGIRAAFARFEPGQDPLIVFDKISNFGLEKLSSGMPIKVEVIGMPSKVMFVTEIKVKGPSDISCSLPLSLVSVERRQNARYPVLPMAMSYMSFSLWQPGEHDPASPPFFDAYRSLSSWVPLLDISAGGICIQSHFPSFINQLDKIDLDPNAQLHLPMQNPISVKASIRWRRRIRNRVVDEHGERYQLDFRVGVEFSEMIDENKNRIRQYLRQLSMADAI